MSSFVFHFDGHPIQAQTGQTIAIALWAAGIRKLRTSTVQHEPRGMFCGMGVCQECVVSVDGRQRESCMTFAHPGMSVSSVSNVQS
jgi:sarcosine oxidase subunit alpha